MKKLTLIFIFFYGFYTFSSNGQNTFPLYGNAGIGTLGPETPLHIYTNQTSETNLITLQNIGSWAYGQLHNIVWKDYSGCKTGAIGMQYDAIGNVDFKIHSLYNQGYRTSSSVSFIVKGNGNVAIGTSNPGDATLKIYKDNLPKFELANSVSTFQIGIANNGWDFAPQSQAGDAIFRKYGTSHNMIFLMNDDNNDGNSYIKFGDNYNYLWFGIFNNRQVRIDGTVTAKEINVQTNVWSDNVFDPEYKLKPLNDFETFIKKNRRLPDVPSEKEVKEKCINIAEMNALLLKKIEEAMLYILELKKQNEELNKRIEELEKNNVYEK
jgi:hypothetical protein